MEDDLPFLAALAAGEAAPTAAAAAEFTPPVAPELTLNHQRTFVLTTTTLPPPEVPPAQQAKATEKVNGKHTENEGATEASPPTPEKTGAKAKSTTTALNSKKKVDRKVVNGVRLRFCICGDKNCAKEMRRWALVGRVNHHLAGYLVLPIYKTDAAVTTAAPGDAAATTGTTPLSTYTNAYLERCLVHVCQLTPAEARQRMVQHHAVKTGKQVRVKFVAYRHFHPRILDCLRQWHGKRQMPVHEKHAIPAALGHWLGGLTVEDDCSVGGFYGPGESYFAVPHYDTRHFAADLLRAEAQWQHQHDLERQVAQQQAQIGALERQVRELRKQARKRKAARVAKEDADEDEADDDGYCLQDDERQEQSCGFSKAELQELTRAFLDSHQDTHNAGGDNNKNDVV